MHCFRALESPSPITYDEAMSVMETVTCPFCGLLCDDLRITADGGALRAEANGCPIAEPAFAQLGEFRDADLVPRVDGAPATLDAAVERAAALLRGARQPLVAGLATDAAGARAALELARRVGAVVDHMNADAKLRNVLANQAGGGVTTTLAEVKNRADLVILAGTDASSRFPRFFERLIDNRDALFVDPAAREIVQIGGARVPGRQHLPCEAARLGEVFAALRALVDGAALQAEAVGGIPVAALAELAGKMQRAAYGVVVWAAADLDVPHGDLTVAAIMGLVKALNRTTRFSGVPLGGSDADTTANQVHTWQSGAVFRSRHARGRVEYDPYHLSTARLLESGEADMLLWISGIGAHRSPPPATIPTVVLGRIGLELPAEPQVLIPVGTPGVDHGGHLFRMDKVVALPLQRLRDVGLPSVAHVLERIAERCS